MKIYLASPFFNQKQRENVEQVASVYRGLGYEVFVPMEHTIPNAWDLPNHQWANAVFRTDVNAIQECDIVVAIVYGMEDDAGTSWEIGYAYGINKPVNLLLMNETTYSLMVVQSAESGANAELEQIDLRSILQS